MEEKHEEELNLAWVDIIAERRDRMTREELPEKLEELVGRLERVREEKVRYVLEREKKAETFLEEVRDIEASHDGMEEVNDAFIDFSIERLEKNLSDHAVLFEMAFFLSKFDPQVYDRFLENFQAAFAHMPQVEREEQGIEHILRIYQVAGEKYVYPKELPETKRK